MTGFGQSRDFLAPFRGKLRNLFALCLVNFVTEKIIKQFALGFNNLATVINVGYFICPEIFFQLRSIFKKNLSLEEVKDI